MNQAASVLTELLQSPGSLGGVTVRLLPLYVVWAAAAGVALARLPRHQMPSILLLMGLAVLFLVSAGDEVLVFALPRIEETYRLSERQVVDISGGVVVATTLANAAAWVLVLVAALGWRGTESVRSRPGSASPGSAAPGSRDHRAKRPRRAATGRP